MGICSYFVCKGCRSAVDVGKGHFDRYGDKIGQFVSNHWYKCGSDFVVLDDNDIMDDGAGGVDIEDIAETYRIKESYRLIEENYNQQLAQEKERINKFINLSQETLDSLGDYEDRLKYLESSYNNGFSLITEKHKQMEDAEKYIEKLFLDKLDAKLKDYNAAYYAFIDFVSSFKPREEDESQNEESSI